MSGQVTIQSFDWRTLARVQRLAPDIPTVYLSAQQEFFDNIAAGKPEGSPWVAGVQARDYGDSVPRMVKVSDRPDFVRAAMERRGMRLPKSTPVEVSARD